MKSFKIRKRLAGALAACLIGAALCAADEPGRVDIGISGVERPAVQRYIDYYRTESARAWLSRTLYASVPYRPYIRQRLRERGLPAFLQYLPIVESDYKPTAVSSSGAVGIWQFMENSMHPFLKKSEYIDERLDVWKETDAALSKLKDNYNMFGSWHLALAAYNMGAGAVRRLLAANPGADFWELAERSLLSRQAAEYVPRLIAVTEIIENAAHYGAIEVGVVESLVGAVEPARFSYLNVRGCIRLTTVARAAEVPLEIVRTLNLELLKDCTPPGESYSIRLPQGAAARAERALRNGGAG